MALGKAKLLEKKQLTETVFELEFEAITNFSFKAGQFINIKILDNIEAPCFRAYSISSAPKQNYFELCIELIENGRGSNWLNSLAVNNEIEFLGPIGPFTFNKSGKDAIFIGTGTGIAPLKSIVEDELNNGNTNKLTLMFGTRYIKNIIYNDFFDKLVKSHPNFSHNNYISRPEEEGWQGNKGRITEYLPKMQIDPKNTEVYICGLKAMVEDVEKILIEKGLPQEAIHFEKYD